MKKSLKSVPILLLLPLGMACDKADKEKEAPSPIGAADVDTSAFCSRLDQQSPSPILEGFTESSAGLFRAKIEWNGPLVAITQAHQATLRFTDLEGKPAPLSLLSFKPFMPTMGHGTIKTSLLTLVQSPSEPDVWTISNVYFSMGGSAGEWVIDIEASACGRSEKVRIPVDQEVL